MRGRRWCWCWCWLRMPTPSRGEMGLVEEVPLGMGPWMWDRSRRCDTKTVRVDHLLRLRLRLLLVLLRQLRNSVPGLLAGSSRPRWGACPETCLCRKSSAQSFGTGGGTLPCGRRTRASRYWKGSLGWPRYLRTGIVSGLIDSLVVSVASVQSSRETHPRTSRLRVTDLPLGTGVVGGHGRSRPNEMGKGEDWSRWGRNESFVRLFPLVPWFPDSLVLPVQLSSRLTSRPPGEVEG
jgi:hypothetical protein